MTSNNRLWSPFSSSLTEKKDWILIHHTLASNVYKPLSWPPFLCTRTRARACVCFLRKLRKVCPCPRHQEQEKWWERERKRERETGCEIAACDYSTEINWRARQQLVVCGLNVIFTLSSPLLLLVNNMCRRKGDRTSSSFSRVLAGCLGWNLKLLYCQTLLGSGHYCCPVENRRQSKEHCAKNV